VIGKNNTTKKSFTKLSSLSKNQGNRFCHNPKNSKRDGITIGDVLASGNSKNNSNFQIKGSHKLIADIFSKAKNFSKEEKTKKRNINRRNFSKVVRDAKLNAHLLTIGFCLDSDLTSIRLPADVLDVVKMSEAGVLQ